MSTHTLIDIGNQLMVGMAEFVVSHDQAVTLCTYPLGACLGVAIYDPNMKVGGLLHSLLPASSIDPVRAANRPGMFLDTGLDAMLKGAYALGAKKEAIRVMVVGGAQIMDESSFFNIGTRNYEVLTGLLAKLGLTIHAQDVGGRTNRTMQLDIATGEIRLKFSGQAAIENFMQAIDDYISNLRHLPPAPRVVPELMRLLNQPDVDSSKVVKLISYDPSLTANVLRICNSAYFGASTPTSDLQEAVTRLGFQQVYQLVVAATGARLLNAAQMGYGLEQGELWKHSVAAAVASQIVARKLGEDQNLVFTAALLHDIGKIVLSQSLNGVYAKVIKETETNQQSLLDAEKKILGVNHAEVGGQLLNRWKFPPNIVSAVWFHHAPKGAGAHQKLACIVYVGNMISYFMGYGYGHVAFALRGRAEVLATLDLQPEAIPQFMIETFEQMHMVETLFALGAKAAE